MSIMVDFSCFFQPSTIFLIDLFSDVYSSKWRSILLPSSFVAQASMALALSLMIPMNKRFGAIPSSKSCLKTMTDVSASS